MREIGVDRDQSLARLELLEQDRRRFWSDGGADEQDGGWFPTQAVVSIATATAALTAAMALIGIGVVLLVVFNIGVLLMRWRVRRRVERGELVGREMPPERPAVGAAAPGAAVSAASDDAFAVAGRR